MISQVRFRDLENNVTLGGILVDNEYIICGCCGGKIYLDNEHYKIIEYYSTWIDLTETITGE